MMRRGLAASAACLVACLLFGILALTPDDASAWWTNQPRYEKQVVTEGDPESPDFAYPVGSCPSVGVEGGDAAGVDAGLTTVAVTVLEAIGF